MQPIYIGVTIYFTKYQQDIAGHPSIPLFTGFYGKKVENLLLMDKIWLTSWFVDYPFSYRVLHIPGGSPDFHQRVFFQALPNICP